MASPQSCQSMACGSYYARFINGTLGAPAARVALESRRTGNANYLAGATTTGSTTTDSATDLSLVPVTQFRRRIPIQWEIVPTRWSC